MDLTSKDYQNGRHKGLKEITGTPVASNTLNVNVWTARGKAVGGRINHECALVLLAGLEEWFFVGMTREVA